MSIMSTPSVDADRFTLPPIEMSNMSCFPLLHICLWHP